VRLGDRTVRKRELLAAVLVLYLLALLTFTFFPRPVLESGDPSAIAEYLRTHANYFYKILYADSRFVAIGNFFMFTPLVVIANRVFPELKLRIFLLTGIFLSALIELSQKAIPGRVSDLVDLASNSASVLVGIFLVRLLHPNSRF
jgi:glycopeptide antibiotics resistance protein